MTRSRHGYCQRMLRIGAAALLAASFAATSQTRSLVGKPAPAFVRRDLHGQTINLRKLRGKVVLLNFWATWCAPCQTEMPVFDSWQRKYAPQGLALIGISMDDDAEAARKVIEKLGISYPVAMGDAKLGELYGRVLGLPMTFLIGRDGRVVAQFQGEADLNSMEREIKAALH
ncbi:MAG TPA: TlpA disulfide reductase family protein [Terracidiphilus sp.]|nr:TlpA disulfide reductase family protein [Terracidiphilus sp.]